MPHVIATNETFDKYHAHLKGWVFWRPISETEIEFYQVSPSKHVTDLINLLIKKHEDP